VTFLNLPSNVGARPCVVSPELSRVSFLSDVAGQFVGVCKVKLVRMATNIFDAAKRVIALREYASFFSYAALDFCFLKTPAHVALHLCPSHTHVNYRAYGTWMKSS
jgi:hypothetical protein